MTYPPGWAETRQRMLDRAGNKCEVCGVPNRTEVWRMVDPGLSGHWMTADRQLHDGGGNPIAHRPEMGELHCPPAYIVLTVARIDHDDANFDQSNLRVLCQRCNVRHNLQHKAEAIRATRARHREEAQLKLFEEGS